jgi:hypothetical protein
MGLNLDSLRDRLELYAAVEIMGPENSTLG